MTKPWISVVVVAYNSGGLLQNCVDALATQTLRAFEAIIIDNASTDGSVEKLRLPDDRFRVFPAGKNLGFAAGCNLGIALSCAPWVAMLNPDAIATSDWLSALERATRRHSGVVMFGSTQIDGRKHDRLDGCGDAYSFLGFPWRGCSGHGIEAIAPEGETFAPCAAAALYRRDVIENMSGFDEAFFCYCEDVDLAFRIRLQGGVCIQVPDAIVYHIGSAITGLESQFTLHHSARNRIWVMLKNLPFGLLVLLLPLHLTYMALTLCIHRQREGPYFSATLSGLCAAFSEAGPMLKARRLIQRNRKVSTVEIARMLCWSHYKLRQRASDIRPLKSEASGTVAGYTPNSR